MEANAVDCLIFSKNRPAQLDLLLRSIEKYASNIYAPQSVILVKATDDFYRRGYAQVQEDHPEWHWWVEDNFQEDVMKDFLGRRWWTDDEPPPVSFLVDDDVFYRDPTIPERTPWSFRGGDYDYPFSLDGNVYERWAVLALLDGLTFTDPTELEARAHEKALKSPRVWSTVHPCDPPCLVGVPLNRVSVSSGMPSMGVHEYDLNERYLAGERLQLITHPKDGFSWRAHENLDPIWETPVNA